MASGKTIYVVVSKEDFEAVRAGLSGAQCVIDRRPTFDVRLRNILAARGAAGAHRRSRIAAALTLISSAFTVAGPNLPTTMPAARLARCAASASEAPAASPSASAAMTVSPAPVTSDTSRASAGELRFPIRRQQPHAVLAARDQHALAAAPARGRVRRRVARFVCGPDPHVRDRLRLVVVRRDDRRARVVVDVRDFRIDQDRDAAALPLPSTHARATPREMTPFR